MWGGTPDRNMVSAMKGIPTSWDIKTKKNVKWVAKLGSQTYGNPVVAGGQVYVGTNNAAGAQPQGRRRPGRADVLPGIGRTVSVAAHQREARGFEQGLARNRESAPRRWWKATASTT